MTPKDGLDEGDLAGAPDELVPLEGADDLFDRHTSDLSGGADDLEVEVDIDPEKA